MSVIWHDLECGGYTADLPVWRELAAASGGEILDVGAGTGRVTLDLARAGYAVCALDRDAALLAELERRAAALPITTVCADARDFTLTQRFGLVIVPMQTIQLLGSSRGRRAFLRCARAHLTPAGRVAVAIAEELEPFEVAAGAIGPLPDVCERDGIVYSSLPTAVRSSDDGFWLERDRETVTVAGEHHREHDRIHLDAVSVDTLASEARGAGLVERGGELIAATVDHVSTQVVIFGG